MTETKDNNLTALEIAYQCMSKFSKILSFSLTYTDIEEDGTVTTDYTEKAQRMYNVIYEEVLTELNKIKKDG